jgi:16S rRNA (guanine527-N7)-methyltransferase
MISESTGVRLNALLAQAGLEPLDETTTIQFESYVSLILRWNARLNLTSLQTEGAILSRHLAECIACAKTLPVGVSTLLDFGSGAGLPGIPIALCRPEIEVTLAESQGKKAAFLQEVVRALQTTTKVHSGRAETLQARFDCVVTRAVDKMPRAVASAIRLTGEYGWLALMTTGRELAKLREAAGAEFSWGEPVRLPFADDRILALGQRVNSGA